MVRLADGKKHSGFTSWIWQAWSVKKRHPPIGSNIYLALQLTRFLTLLTIFVAAFMVQTGFFFDDVSMISAIFAGFWLVFLTTIYILWERLSIRAVRYFLFSVLIIYQLRWASAWILLPPEELPVAVIASLLYTPMLLMVLGLMEGQRTGVIVGMCIALFMAVTAQIGALRPEVADVALSDPRIGALIFLLITVYVFIGNAHAVQQALLDERNKQTKLLQAKSNTDPLTGLLNRRGLDMAVTDMLLKHKPFGALMIDIDNFKKLNDDYGHAVGDSVLSRVSAIIKWSVRDSDIAGRWGGEEFLVLCATEEASQILSFGERLRAEIERYPKDGEVPVTVSIGVSRFPLYEPFQNTVERADQALYKAKSEGRNCVRALWSEPSESKNNTEHQSSWS